ncbi:alpha/beta hydrolase [Streptodolium elevatio]|uniref:Alpha/beta fold hydrolase n=1 Tax=Streptodolium elevatio TaxID=3157996 RepID=A0ABV3DIG5_9ACTN
MRVPRSAAPGVVDATPRLSLRTPGPTDQPRSVVVVLPGGRSHSTARASRRNLAYLRMAAMAGTLRRRLDPRGAAVAVLRYRLRGWNGSAADPVQDVRWALDQVQTRFPGAPMVLVGHSMGGRAALWAADHPYVTGVCALAPWTPAGDPVRQLADRSVLIVHGLRDRRTSPEASHEYALRALSAGMPVRRVELPHAGHAMLRRRRDWDALVADFAGSMLVDQARMPARLTEPTAAPTTERRSP